MISPLEILIRLAVAAVLGSIIGSERQRHEWAAGLRTHMLVCIGSTLIMIVSAYGFRDVVRELCGLYEFELGKILQKPMDGLIKYHS